MGQRERLFLHSFRLALVRFRILGVRSPRGRHNRWHGRYRPDRLLRHAQGFRVGRPGSRVDVRVQRDSPRDCLPHSRANVRGADYCRRHARVGFYRRVAADVSRAARQQGQRDVYERHHRLDHVRRRARTYLCPQRQLRRHRYCGRHDGKAHQRVDGPHDADVRYLYHILVAPHIRSRRGRIREAGLRYGSASIGIILGRLGD